MTPEQVRKWMGCIDAARFLIAARDTKDMPPDVLVAMMVGRVRDADTYLAAALREMRPLVQGDAKPSETYIRVVDGQAVEVGYNG